MITIIDAALLSNEAQRLRQIARLVLFSAYPVFIRY